MEDVSRYVSIAYLVLGLVVAWVLARTFALVLGAIGPSLDPILFADIQLSAVLGVASTIGIVTACFKSEKIYAYSTEVAYEMTKVTWPTGEETKSSVGTVISVAIFTAICIFLVDMVWQLFTSAIFHS